MMRLLALYGQPDDTAAFDDHYWKTHVPLVRKMPHLRRFQESRSLSSPGGENAPYYLLAEMDYDSEEHIQESLASQAGADAVDDLAKFATGGVTVLIADLEEAG